MEDSNILQVINEKGETKKKNSLRLKKGKKPIRLTGKIALGIATIGLATVVATDGIPVMGAQIEYNGAKMEEAYKGRPQAIAELVGKEKTKAIADYYAEAIRENRNINDKDKEVFISEFTERIINKYGHLFTEETIANMYAVASTERLNKMDEDTVKHGYADGTYTARYNRIELAREAEEGLSTVSHEQLHAIVKSGFNSGFQQNEGVGRGINEGTTSFINEDGSYADLVMHIRKIGSIIGYEKLINYYFSSDLDGLTEELKKYIPEEAEELITTMDKLAYLNREYVLVSKNFQGDAEEKTAELQRIKNSIQRCEEKIKRIFYALRDNAFGENPKIKLPKIFKDYSEIGDSIYGIYRTEI